MCFGKVMVHGFRITLVLIFAVFAIHAQSLLDLPNYSLASLFVLKKSQLDAAKRAGVFVTNGKPERVNNEFYNHLQNKIGNHLDPNDIAYNELDDSQYKICCELLRFPPRLDQTMLVLYFNGQGVQFPFDKDSEIDLLSEFSKLGWKPVEARLGEFLMQYPYNQEALSLSYSIALEKLASHIFPYRQSLSNANTDKASGDEALSSFIEAMKLIVKDGGLDWMTHGLTSLRTLYDLGTLSNLPTLTENTEFQLVLGYFVNLIEKEIKQRPLATYAQKRYNYWANYSALLKNRPDPMEFLHGLRFPKGNYALIDVISPIADTYITNPRADQNGNPIVNDAFKFLNDAGEWMLGQDPHLDGPFRLTFATFAIKKAQLMIMFQRYSELETHLEDTRTRVGTDWNEVVNGIKNPEFFTEQEKKLDDMPQSARKRIDAILDLPPITQSKIYFRGILISHNFPRESFDRLRSALLQGKVNFYLTQDRALPRDSWSLFNANVLVGSGSIVPTAEGDSYISEFGELLGAIREEERKNLMELEAFIRMNPDHLDAMDMYCEEAAKFLPDKELEQKMLNYSRLTYTPPSLDAYSKMTNKEDWSRLATKVIGEGLLRLSEVPISATRNPWLNLSQWEDLDIQKNPIDWYGFMKNSVFWYAPEYYFAPLEAPMPEPVFTKYLNQAELAGDWKAVLAACTAIFRFDKKRCSDKRILATWERAEEIVKTQG